MSPALDAPASKPRARNRLRKLTKLRSGSAASNTTNNNVSPRASSDSARAAAQGPQSPIRGSIPPSPDLSSQKWLEYIRKSGYLCPMESSPHLQHTRSRSLTQNTNKVVPELAHLAIDIPEKSPRRSLDTQQPTGSPRSGSLSASSSLRRYAKTPVLRVGQLEGSESSTPGAESIAAQYRALLKSRSHDELRGGVAEDGHDGNDVDTRQTSIEAIRGATRRRSPLLPPPSPSSTLGAGAELEPETEPRGSPTSDGTLVAFEEDTIFFKPVSFWPEPLSPIRESDGGRGGVEDDYNHENEDGFEQSQRPLPQPGVLSLQIAMNLLSRELSCAVSNEALRAPTDVRQLQTWVMIEAYEALRDQVLQMALPEDEAEALRRAFGMWLRALYRVHDGFARETSGPSDSDIEALQAEDLD
ncbi:hypothetical protein J7T55_000549 [Diaporthe amygdali]|uniref:uncharacterized protein n=1 Tax=Phomopsis amygdali TaxID=1214568 RepID=UPI0022FDC6C6|nr:uncharacterized protein J7T55_000549 [Diaporthe amygdali]KAJ0110117.1 hypothetical protein J7T55_000549 [Diaporthe amygdali]